MLTFPDVHEAVMSRFRDRRIKEQIYAVLAHAEVNLYAIDVNGNFTMAEGAMAWSLDKSDGEYKDQVTGKNLFEAFGSPDATEVQPFISRVQDIIEGKIKESEAVDIISSRSYRTRLIAELEQNDEDGAQAPTVAGVLGLSIDISDVEARAALEVENSRLQMEEKSAQEASRMKSQFLANVSRTLKGCRIIY